ncbi:glycosyltransferase family 4 protein [Aneurinibacillus tyrosinisolvens]|uniref:glycosyltransferase family 4 protein n=1 Tax=Aneurinibacillus tyrosinisolvens TaxID=1443435 RepID=UPI00063F15CF|nr:glycosyltransferase family 4 protein [Aneurinibacillus tyrosinisolvens]
MKIIHGPIEIAGQMGILCGALKEMGHHAYGYNYFQTYLQYKENIINSDLFEIGKIAGDVINYFDIFHFHYASTFLPDYKDLELLARIGKPIIMHHWGNDVRKTSIALLNNSYVYTGDSPSEDEIDRKLTKIGKFASAAIVQDYEVLPYVAPYYKKVFVLPLALNLTRFIPAYPEPFNNVPLVIHAPTNPEFKGTAAVEKVIKELEKVATFQYKRIENMSHEEAVRLYNQADIIIDQILCGSYGLLSVEAMALGKPVIAFIRDDLVSGYEITPPICNANPDTLYTVLKDLLSSGEVRRQKGMAGRKFVESYHDSRLVAKQLVTIYGNL